MILNHSKKGFGKYDESKVRKVTGRGGRGALNSIIQKSSL
jgi:hypothetical protein